MFIYACNDTVNITFHFLTDLFFSVTSTVCTERHQQRCSLSTGREPDHHQGNAERGSAGVSQKSSKKSTGTFYLSKY